MSEKGQQQERDPVKSTVTRMLLIAVGMFGFGFALVPLYDVFCDITGLNGKTSDEKYEVTDTAIDTSRTVKVQFVTTNNDGMVWDFKPSVAEMTVHPGEVATTEFYARNPRGFDMTAQAIPSLVPFKAAEYFHKTECFCFNQQSLAAGEEVQMPLRFIVDKDLPKNVKTITLAYTLFDVTESKVAQAN
jgi:cytochrome c oxidase assembly protein subunit 11